MLNTEALEQRINDYMEQYGSRGLAVTVLKDGAPLWRSTFGTRNAKGDPVTEKTIFPIASITKTFTGSLTASLVEQGIVGWNDKLRDLGDFAFSDPIATRYATLADALGHRTGLARNDYSWTGNSVTQEELVKRIRHLGMLCELRTEYHYTNLMYSAVTWLLGQKTGRLWPELMREHITDPCGIQDITFSVSDIPTLYDNYAVPYTGEGAEQRDLPYVSLDAVGGCGAINTTIEGMEQWCKFAIGRGVVDGRQVISTEVFNQMIAPLISAHNSMFWNVPEIRNKTYAAGWQNEVFRGRQMLRHTGGIRGFFSMMAALPDEGIAVCVLNNTCNAPIEDLLTFEIFDELLGIQSGDYWHREYQKMNRENHDTATEAMARQESRRKSGTQTSHPMEAYAGLYKHPAFPDSRIICRGGSLFLIFGSGGMGEIPLEHWHYDTFMMRHSPTLLVPMMFKTDLGGEVSVMDMKIEPLMDFVPFRRAE